MSKRSKNYRKIWERRYNACILPGMRVHHIDGDKTNDTPEEHWQIQYDQGDETINSKGTVKS